LRDSLSSVAAQVISRAHRMGATRDVSVELLVMRGTVEEALLRRQVQWAMHGGGCGGGRAAGGLGDGSGDPATAAAQGAGDEAGGGGGGAGERRKVAEADRRVERNALLLALRPVSTGAGPA
jgi:hypothetical protein